MHWRSINWTSKNESEDSSTEVTIRRWNSENSKATKILMTKEILQINQMIHELNWHTGTEKKYNELNRLAD